MVSLALASNIRRRRLRNREAMRTESALAVQRADLGPLPPDLERKPSLEDRPSVIPDFDCHKTPFPVAMHSVPRHVRERAGGLFLNAFNGGEFEPLLVRGDFAFVAHVEIIAWHIHQALLVGVSQKLATREAEGQSLFSHFWRVCARETLLELPPVTQNGYSPQL
jgi:hypothetical protein